MYFRLNILKRSYSIFFRSVLLTGLGLLLLQCSLEAASPVEPYSSAVKKQETDFAAKWIASILNQGKGNLARYEAQIPFQFFIGKRSSREWIKTDNAKIESDRWIESVRKHRLIWKDSVSSLVCEMELTEFKDFPAFEWLVRLRNEGSGDSPIIHDFKALDISWNDPKGGVPILYRSIGGPASEIDYTFKTEPMRQSMWNDRRKVRMDTNSKAAFFESLNNVYIPNDSRPSAVWLPFFNYQTGNDGILIGLGWNGRWFTEFDHKGKGKTTVSAGMEFLNTKLLPGESIRSPLVLIAYWNGEPMHAQNMFRQLILAHHAPRQQNGDLVVPPVFCLTWGGVPAKNHLKTIAKIAEKKIPFDAYWIDAGWYGTGTVPSNSVFQGDWGPMAGDWRVNRNWHPDTLRPVSEAAAKAGMKFLLWVEPERAVQGRPITLEHPEYFYPTGNKKPNAGQTLLLNLGKTEAMNWVLDTVSNLIIQNKVDWYREDFNLDPRFHWNEADPPDRKGIAEIRFVENLYHFWDTLKERHPCLQIDNCASGGRRIELETLTRAISLCRSDYNCFPIASLEAIQDHSYGISYWIPLEGTFNINRSDIADSYEMRSGLSSGMSIRAVNPDLTEEKWDLLRRHVLEAKRARDYFYGDYYPLTNSYSSNDSWSAYHFYLPKEKRGMLVAFRRPKCDISSMKFDLLTIPNEETVWEFENADTGSVQKITGKEIREKGFEVILSNPRGSSIYYYHSLQKR
ncbi:MAG: alpha-galactosidase [Planctomycetia bacterium]|nr:alpha-galactosidase [Planctomycetia bacterium]